MGRHFRIFTSPGTKRMSPLRKPTAPAGETYGSRKGDIQQVNPFFLNKGRFANFYHTKSTARMPSPTATMVEINPGIMKEWFSTYFPIRVVPVVSKLMAATTVG